MDQDPAPEFTQKCRQKLDQGVKLIRIHLVEQPYSSYLQWELEFYKRVSLALRGEAVYLLDRLEAGGLEFPAGDLMIFDKKRAVVNTYNDEGFMTHETFYEERDNISEFLALREQILKLAEPLKIWAKPSSI